MTSHNQLSAASWYASYPCNCGLSMQSEDATLFCIRSCQEGSPQLAWLWERQPDGSACSQEKPAWSFDPVLSSYLSFPPPTLLTISFTSPHNQTHDIITITDSPRKRNQQRPPKHRHQRTGWWCTQETRFGQHTGWWPCARSIGNFLLWLWDIFLPQKLPPPARPGTSIGKLLNCGEWMECASCCRWPSPCWHAAAYLWLLLLTFYIPAMEFRSCETNSAKINWKSNPALQPNSVTCKCVESLHMCLHPPLNRAAVHIFTAYQHACLFLSKHYNFPWRQP